MEHKCRSAIREESQYTPTFPEQCQQAILEMQSRINSLEQAVQQLQHDVYRGSNISPAPLGIDLDDVGPPPWLLRAKEESDHGKVPRPKVGLESKLLQRS